MTRRTVASTLRPLGLLAALCIALLTSNARAVEILSDDFTGDTLSPEWSASYSSTDDAKWQRSIGNSKLTTTGLIHDPGSDSNNTSVTLSRSFEGIAGEFFGEFIHSWDYGTGREVEQPNVYIRIRAENTLIISMGMYDDFDDAYGVLKVEHGTGSAEIDALSSGTAHWTFHRVGDHVDVYLNGGTDPFFSTAIKPDAVIDGVDVRFSARRMKDGWTWTSTQSVDLVSLQTVPEPATLALLAIGLTWPLQRRRR